MKNTAHFAHWPFGVTRTVTVPETTIYDNLAMTTKKYPNKVAIEYYGRSYSYQEIYNEVEKLAAYLEKELAVQQGEHMLLFMQNSPHFIISLFAILRVRAVVVPINPMSTTDDLEYFINDGDIKHALVSQELYGKVAPLREKGLLEGVIVASYSEYAAPEHALGELPPEVAAPTERFTNTVPWSVAINHDLQPSPYTGESEDTAFIPYTSGTTGVPKGCVHTNRSVQANTVSANHWVSLTPDVVTLTTLPLFHVTGVLHSLFAPIYIGATMVVLTRWDRDYAAKAIETYRCTHWINISTMLIDFLANPNLEKYDISSLQLVGGGGATLPEAVGNQLKQVTGLEYVEGYGLSETISHTHFNPPQRPKLQCLGIPSFSVDARIIDIVTGEELGPNEEGELIVHGPQLFKEYYKQPEETEASHVVIDGKKFFKTGDIVTMDEEGYFFIVDRLKRMINASGYKVWPTEVESILYQHPAVQQACVVSAPDERRGETVKAFIILNEEYKGKVTENEIIEWAKGKMAAYKYPRMVEFRDRLPMTSSGKILWRQLQDETVKQA
ncbi:long-chain-fatty-acid--CoA ligase [Compostibacillus humi]|uniref:Long-chain-fatty-acid--CoA ligase n=1 Tax=Compostibacillus humi TaxID=1245525 RepID=A0A8J2TPX3_9BACI|nr:long-chain-fatty-acid--CoA ligase [Compostibacillus humi]GFZ87233.1 long-chain-fatty-acid--CoA ligase [Compostibacillus humi]